MSTLTSVSALLLSIKLQIVKHPVFTRGTGVPLDDPAYMHEAEELERMSDKLALLIRNINNHRNLLSAQERGLWNVPRDQRYRAASSIAQQQGETGRLLEAASDLQKLLQELMRRNGMLSDGEIAEKITEFIKEWHEHAHSGHQTQIDSHPAGPAYQPLQPGHFQGSPEALTIAVWAALRALAYYMKRRKGQAA
jgi:hypothetical protein